MRISGALGPVKKRLQNNPENAKLHPWSQALLSIHRKEEGMKRIIRITVLAGAVMSAAFPVMADDIQSFVAKYTEVNGKGYMQPLADAFGACMNTGLYQSAHVSRVGFHLTLGVETMTAVIGAGQKTFAAKTENFNPPTTVQAPTLFGSTQNMSVRNLSNGTAYDFPGGMNVKLLPLVAPQVTVGSIMGTDATIRWFSMAVGKDFGTLKLFGWGIRHSLSQYMPLLPFVDIAVGYYAQTFKIGSVVDATASLISLQGSISKSVLLLYGGIGVESSTLKIAYEPEKGGDKIRFDLKGGNKMRITLGAGLNLPGVKLHADYNISTLSTIGLGVGFGL
jgi:hypothetical protein